MGSLNIDLLSFRSWFNILWGFWQSSQSQTLQLQQSTELSLLQPHGGLVKSEEVEDEKTLEKAGAFDRLTTKSSGSKLASSSGKNLYSQVGHLLVDKFGKHTWQMECWQGKVFGFSTTWAHFTHVTRFLSSFLVAA
jgi:hypothetical protein